MKTLAVPTNSPRADQPTAIPIIRGIVPFRPCWELCAAHNTLLGPGEKHIAIWKAKTANSKSVCMQSGPGFQKGPSGDQCLVYVGPQILDAFDPDAHPDEAGYNPGLVSDVLRHKHVAGVERAFD